jgi:hypothetical protein
VAAGRTDIRVDSGRENSHGPAGAGRLERAVDAAHFLCDLLWDELHVQMRSGRSSEERAPVAGVGAATRSSAQLAEHLAHLASTVALLADKDDGATPLPTPPGERSAPGASRGAPRASATRPVAVLIDERDELASASGHERSAAAQRRPRGWETPAPALRDEPVAKGESPAPSAHRSGDAREVTGGEGSPPWLAMIAAAIDRFEHERAPFAVLLIEVLDAGVAAEVDELVETSVAQALGTLGPASIAPETSDRYWLLVPKADRQGARAVAERLVNASEPATDGAGRTDAADRYFAAIAARRTTPPTGSPASAVELATGTASCPDDGQDLSALIAQAHIELAAARSGSAPPFPASEPVLR